MVIIYSITSDKGNKVYIGSTTVSLAQRTYSHKCDSHSCTSNILFDEYGIENCIFTVLEECTVEQRTERERYHIENTLNVVNKCLPGRTRKERRDTGIYMIQEKQYRDATKDKQREQKKEYYKKNKEIFKKRNQDYYAKKKLAQQQNVLLLGEGTTNTNIES